MSGGGRKGVGTGREEGKKEGGQLVVCHRMCSLKEGGQIYRRSRARKAYGCYGAIGD